jgi:hypothetical protein
LPLAAWLALLAAGCNAPPVHAQVTPVPGDPLTGSGVVSRTVNTYSQLFGTALPTALVAE